MAAAAAAVVHDDDDCHERHVHVDLAYGGGDVGDEVVPYERVAARNFACDQGHHHDRPSEPSRFLESWDVMTFLLLPNSVMVARLYPSTTRLQHRNLEGCT